MPVKPLDPNATATITVTGLALGCYNKKNSKWEVGFIRAPRHKLSITVTKQLSAGKTAKLCFEIDEHHTIFVECTDPVTSGDPRYKPMKSFSREATTDINFNDLRWVVDFDDELNKGKPVKLKKPADPVIPMYVSKPRFLYADDARWENNDKAQLVLHPSRTPVRPFKRFSEGASADLTCGKPGGKVTLRVDGPLGFSVVLPQISGEHYQILMDNTCPPVDSKPSDFTHYYSIVKADVEYDIDIPGGGHGEGAVCNKGFLSMNEQLFPLPK